MREMRTQSPAVLVAIVVLAMMLWPTADALASSGEFTRAEASAGWTLGGVAGSATWSGCQVESPPRHELEYPWVGTLP